MSFDGSGELRHKGGITRLQAVPWTWMGVAGFSAGAARLGRRGDEEERADRRGPHVSERRERRRYC
jgi:hypothetical protein